MVRWTTTKWRLVSRRDEIKIQRFRDYSTSHAEHNSSWEIDNDGLNEAGLAVKVVVEAWRWVNRNATAGLVRSITTAACAAARLNGSWKSVVFWEKKESYVYILKNFLSISICTTKKQLEFVVTARVAMRLNLINYTMYCQPSSFIAFIDLALIPSQVSKIPPPLVFFQIRK